MPQREGQHRKTRWGDASEERDVSRRAVLFPDMAGWFAVRMALRAPGSHTSSEIIVYGQTHLAVPVVCRAHQPRATGHPLLSFTSILLFCLLLVLASWGWILTLHTGGGPEANRWVGKAEARQAPQLLWGGWRLRGACSHLRRFPSLSLPALGYKRVSAHFMPMLCPFLVKGQAWWVPGLGNVPFPCQELAQKLLHSEQLVPLLLLRFQVEELLFSCVSALRWLQPCQGATKLSDRLLFPKGCL